MDGHVIDGWGELYGESGVNDVLGDELRAGVE